MSLVKLTQKEKAFIYNILFNEKTRSGRFVETVLILLSILSVIMVFFESSHNVVCGDIIIESCEVSLTIIFTLEYILRLTTTPRPHKYPLSFFGIVDLLTLLPIWIIYLFPTIGLTYTTFFRLMRVLRILRLIKLLRYMNAASIIWQGIVSSYKQLLVFFFIIGVIVFLFSGIMYVVEGPNDGFDNLSTSLYWAVVTVTTVGYGDITPHTPIGRMVSSILIIIGYSIMAIPTGLLSSNMTEFIRNKKSTAFIRYCNRCNEVIENKKAYFCHNCGSNLKLSTKDEE
ncbi:ion transporter [Klebsiella sp. T2.Ur]|nr:ion transporter [Klebsiella sp. T2.Ur]